VQEISNLPELVKVLVQLWLK